ncbi:mRNA-decapping enzyme 1A [Phlebotomus argentipes]|uniref:mRNA-decapping enzyme 1A n=1 Tax=Phlebotomus argentipes TaxID=94469 RepID=UPI002892AC89|nr:mRNA-decapping enzyme 1A [Phlebotomus argentipes]
MADELRMNLAAVKRADPYAKNIIETSAHVAFYTFNYEENEWEKTDVEGAFFVYRRNAEPFHSIFINNRLNTNSLVEPITADLEIQTQPPFLLYRNERSRIRGFWFYNKDELKRVADLISGYVKECQKKQKAMEASAGDKSKPVNIFSMLSKAQDDFNKVNQHKGAGGQEATPQSVMNFFAAAAKPTAAKEPPLLQRLMSNPAHSVEHIEKQQRAVTPHEANARPASPQRSENGLTSALRQSGSPPPPTEGETELYQLLKRVDIGKPALMPPTMFRKAGAASPPGEAPQDVKPEPLTQNQLSQAMMYLLKNDPEFVKKLHEAYLKSFAEMVSL